MLPGSKYYVDMMTRQLGFTTIKKCKPENNKLILLCERYGESHSRRCVRSRGSHLRFKMEILVAFMTEWLERTIQDLEKQRSADATGL